jgi:hypothetical protein
MNCKVKLITCVSSLLGVFEGQKPGNDKRGLNFGEDKSGVPGYIGGFRAGADRRRVWGSGVIRVYARDGARGDARDAARMDARVIRGWIRVDQGGSGVIRGMEPGWIPRVDPPEDPGGDPGGDPGDPGAAAAPMVAPASPWWSRPWPGPDGSGGYRGCGCCGGCSVGGGSGGSPGGFKGIQGMKPGWSRMEPGWSRVVPDAARGCGSPPGWRHPH